MHPMRRARARQRCALRRGLRSIDAYAFFDLLTDSSLLDQVEAHLPAHRERLLPPTEVLAMFLAQALSADRSCQQAVNAFVARRVAGGLSACSTSTGAFCRARQRLPEALVSSLLRVTGQRLADTTAQAGHWQGRRVRLVDGTTIAMPDTAANQAAFPQMSTQKPGLGFPLCRLLALLCLSSGAVIDAATCPVKGKGNAEQSLLRTVLDHLHSGDVLLGDALFATYFLLAELKHRGVDGVFEQNGGRRRSTDFRRGQRLGTRDHVIQLHKPVKRPAWMTPASVRCSTRHTGRSGGAGGRKATRNDTAMSPPDTQGVAQNPLSTTLARRAGSSLPQNHAGHGNPELPDACHGDERTAHLPARLQPRARPYASRRPAGRR